MKLKVCGLTRLEQLEQLDKAEIDYAGLIFYEKSARYAFEKLKGESDTVRNLSIKKVGVFVNADMGFLKSLVVAFGLYAVQLHGNESPQYCSQLMRDVIVIKVFRISDSTENLDELVKPFQSCCHYFLFDTDTASYGGSGQRFDWALLQKNSIDKPFFLSGGISPADMGNLKSLDHACFYAVDINSRFETSPGQKNLETVIAFANGLKEPTYD